MIGSLYTPERLIRDIDHTATDQYIDNRSEIRRLLGPGGDLQ